MALVLIFALLLPAAASEGDGADAEDALAAYCIECLSSGADYADDELIVVYNSTGSIDLEDAGIVSADEVFSSDDEVTAVVRIDDDVTLAEAMEALLGDPDISWVQPNYTYELLDTSSGTSVESDAAAAQYYLWESSFVEAWEYVRVEGNVTIAVLDTGCSLDHEDLTDNVDSELAYDVTTGKLLKNSRVRNNGDSMGHGTNVCGVIAASAANGVGIAGASYDANILPIKIFDEMENCTTADVIAGYDYLDGLISSGELTDLKVINMSVGYYSTGTTAEDIALESVITDMLEENGVITVCAGGNDSDGINESPYCYPADFEVCVSVTAVNRSGANAYFSDFNDAKDISAYGVDIYTTDSDGGYCYVSGTSFAAPQVSAAAALLWAADESLSPYEVIAILQASADEVTGNVHEESGSAGILNMLAAVEYLSGGISDIIELYGSDRYETMTAIVQEAFSGSGSTYAVVADGYNFPDALSAASLAGVLDAPIILISENTVSDALSVLAGLGVTDVYIVGGTSSVSSGTERKINDSGIRTVRIAGETRQETALEIANEVPALSGADASDTCLVASGTSFSDALCGSPYSYWSSSPVYLTESDGSLSDEVLSAIEEGGYSNVIVLGGTSSVSAGAFSALEGIGGVSVTRLGGSTRYETSELIAEWSVSRGMSYNGLAVASGSSFPDALSGSALCGQTGSVLLLSNTTSEDSSVLQSVLEENADSISLLYILGGNASVGSSIRRMISRVLIQGE